jgi:hypothetical protein
VSDDLVFLPADRQLGGRISVTGVRHFNQCPRAGFLYALTKGEDKSHEMERGSALHHALEVGTREVMRLGEVMVPPDVAKDIVNSVLANPAFAVPVEEHDYLRESVYRWAEHTTFDPSQIVAVEQLMELEVGGWVLRAKIDFATFLEGGGVLSIEDYKSSRAMVTWEEIGRKRPDGSIAAKDFQLVAYALAMAFGYPVRVEKCARCGGTGKVPARDHHTATVEAAAAVNEFYSAPMAPSPCPACRHGRVETREPFRVADKVQRFDLAYVYPGIKQEDGAPARRGVSLTRLELHEYLTSMDGIMRRLGHAVETGEWPAVPSSHCDTECPARSMCPRLEQRSKAGRLNTPEEVKAEAERQFVRDLESRAVWKEIKASVKAMPGQSLRFGADRVIEPVYSEFEEITDKDGMWAAIERTARYGEPFDRSQFTKQRSRSPVTVRKLTPAEMAGEINDESEGS